MKRATWIKSATVTAAISASIGFGVSCNNKPPPAAVTTRPAMSSSSQPMHSVQVRQLKPLMQTILHSTNKHWPTTLPSDVEQPVDAVAQQKAYDEAAMLADELAISANQIPAMVAGKSIPDDLRAGFLHEVALLKDQAMQLKANAMNKRAEAMSRNLDAINVTCINCHSKYRDLTGNLDPLQARRPTAWEAASAQ